jgi:Plasmid pRiA4b ORF-3-like protein
MIYRFKVWFEDVEDVTRWIDVKPSHTFLEFHNIIQESIGFDKKEFASFYISDDKWRKLMEISLEDMHMGEDDQNADPVMLMKDSRLRDFINDPHQRFVYITDFVANWTLFCELQAIADEQPKKEYPLIYRSEGKAPRQREDSKFKLLDDNEFDALAAKILAAKGAANIMEGAEEELLAAEDTDDEEKDEFGFDELEGGTDDDFNLDNGFSELSS